MRGELRELALGVACVRLRQYKGSKEDLRTTMRTFDPAKHGPRLSLPLIRTHAAQVRKHKLPLPLSLLLQSRKSLRRSKRILDRDPPVVLFRLAIARDAQSPDTGRVAFELVEQSGCRR